MDGAFRLLLDGVERSSHASRANARKALAHEAKSADEKEAKFLNLIYSLTSKDIKDRNGSHAAKLLLYGALTAEMAKHMSKIGQSILPSVAEKTPLGLLAEKEIEIIKNVSSKFSKKFPDVVLNSISRFMEAEKHALSEAFEYMDSKITFMNSTIIKLAQSTEKTVENEIHEIIHSTYMREKNLRKIMDFIYVISQVTVVGGAATYISKYVTSYMNKHSGPYFTSYAGDSRNQKSVDDDILTAKSALEKKLTKNRIRDPYPCGFSNKQGDIPHPLDNVIRAHVPQPCSDWRKYDPCGGWASVAPGSRLYNMLKHDELLPVLSQLNGGYLSCEIPTIGDVLVAMIHDLGHTVSSVIHAVTGFISDSLRIGINWVRHILFVVAGIGVSFLTFKLIPYRKIYALFISLALGIVTTLILYYVYRNKLRNKV